MSQRTLAEKAGLSSSSISRVESGQHDPTWGSMRRIAEGLGVSMETLSELSEGFESSP
jgi:transcriptional regulator with XRE-family HTH domain